MERPAEQQSAPQTKHTVHIATVARPKPHPTATPGTQRPKRTPPELTSQRATPHPPAPPPAMPVPRAPTPPRFSSPCSAQKKRSRHNHGQRMPVLSTLASLNQETQHSPSCFCFSHGGISVLSRIKDQPPRGMLKQTRQLKTLGDEPHHKHRHHGNGGGIGGVAPASFDFPKRTSAKCRSQSSAA